MSNFKKKTQIPENITNLNLRMSMLLGSSANQPAQNYVKGKVSRQLILTCAMFWDSKQRIQRIKSLILKQQELQQFQDCQDFKIQQLSSIELLSLSKNSIVHLHPISVLQTLVCLNINNNKVYDLSPLNSLRLEQLYAANNLITNIDAIKDHSKLRILNLFCNKIARIEDTLRVLHQLESLEELDIENNPAYSQKNRNKFIELPKICRLNGDLILNEQKQLSSSCVIMPSAKFRDTHTSFGNFKNSPNSLKNQKNNEQSISEWSIKSTNKCSYQEVSTKLREKISDLQMKYFQIDDKFQSEIALNVQLKAAYHQSVLKRQKNQREQEQNIDLADAVKCLKRKVKAMKENLFNNSNPKKSELLREIFQMELQKNKVQGTKSNNEAQTDHTNLKVWKRKFDYDEQIIIGTIPNPSTQKAHKKILQPQQQSDNKYFIDEDQEIQMLLAQNSSAIDDLRKQLGQLSAGN